MAKYSMLADNEELAAGGAVNVYPDKLTEGHPSIGNHILVQLISSDPKFIQVRRIVSYTPAGSRVKSGPKQGKLVYEGEPGDVFHLDSLCDGRVNDNGSLVGATFTNISYDEKLGYFEWKAIDYGEREFEESNWIENNPDSTVVGRCIELDSAYNNKVELTSSLCGFEISQYNVILPDNYVRRYRFDISQVYKIQNRKCTNIWYIKDVGFVECIGDKEWELMSTLYPLLNSHYDNSNGSNNYTHTYIPLEDRLDNHFTREDLVAPHLLVVNMSRVSNALAGIVQPFSSIINNRFKGCKPLSHYCSGGNAGEASTLGQSYISESRVHIVAITDGANLSNIICFMLVSIPKDSGYLVMFDSNKTAIKSGSPIDKQEKPLVIEYIHVLNEDRRRNGLATLLQQIACVMHRHSGAILTSVLLSVKNDNDGANKMYRELGYKKLGGDLPDTHSDMADDESTFLSRRGFTKKGDNKEDDDNEGEEPAAEEGRRERGSRRSSTNSGSNSNSGGNNKKDSGRSKKSNSEKPTVSATSSSAASKAADEKKKSTKKRASSKGGNDSMEDSEEEAPPTKKKARTTTAAKKKTKSKKYDDDSHDMDFESEEEPPPKKRATKKKAPAKKKASRRDDSDDDSDIEFMGQSQATSVKPSRSRTARATTKKHKYNYDDSDVEEINDSEEDETPAPKGRGRRNAQYLDSDSDDDEPSSPKSTQTAAAAATTTTSSTTTMNSQPLPRSGIVLEQQGEATDVNGPTTSHSLLILLDGYVEVEETIGEDQKYTKKLYNHHTGFTTRDYSIGVGSKWKVKNLGPSRAMLLHVSR